jgi:pilus assembly protein FimV
MGELFQKAGDQKAAAESFARVANCYLRDGFLLKAVALLKQVLKLSPGLLAARETLAATLTQLGLMAEAVEHLNVLLREYAVLERADDAARIAQALADIDAA